jgi:hypothetical protein
MESHGRSYLHEGILMLKAYALVDCPVQSIIQQKTVEFLKTNTVLFERKDLELWNKIDTVALIRSVPELPEFYRSIGLKLREIAVTVWNSHSDVPLHIDELPVTSKINFPILNTEDTYNEWYTVPDNLLATVNPVINQFGSAFYDLKDLDLGKCTKIAEVVVTQPVVFNSQIPHRIRITEQAKFPRIVMSCTFFNEPTKWLQ